MTTKENNLKLIDTIEVELSAVIGKSIMSIKDLKEIGEGSVIPLDKGINDAIDIYINNQLIAQGELTSSDEGIGVKITEVLIK